MTDLTPTDEQIAVITAASNTEDNLLVSALAGAAKTSTLILLAEALAPKSVLALAFNKSIAVELGDRLPSNCDAKTLNSIGHRAWGMALNKRLKLDKNKSYRLLREIAGLYTGEQAAEIRKNFYDLLKAVNSLKSAGWIPDGHHKEGLHIATDQDFFQSLELILKPYEEDIMRQVMLDSISESKKGVIDFADQIMMPTLFKAPFDYYPVVLIDEAQDLSTLNHMMLKKIARKRLIAVGDPCQAIYGFRGADNKSMEKLKDQFSMKEFHLTVSFRCSKAVVNEALWRAPQMKYSEWAIEGEVKTLGVWEPEDIEHNSVIICRNNAPLFRLAVNFLKEGIYAQVVGNDIADGLIKTLREIGPDHLNSADAIEEAREWVDSRLKRQRNAGTLHDKYECIVMFLSRTDSIGDAKLLIEQVVNSNGNIKLMTGHKSKGLEYPTVYFLDEALVKKEGQDPNLRYVIQTRAQEKLIYINSVNLSTSSQTEKETI